MYIIGVINAYIQPHHPIIKQKCDFYIPRVDLKVIVFFLLSIYIIYMCIWKTAIWWHQLAPNLFIYVCYNRNYYYIIIFYNLLLKEHLSIWYILLFFYWCLMLILFKLMDEFFLNKYNSQKSFKNKNECLIIALSDITITYNNKNNKNYCNIVNSLEKSELLYFEK